MTLRVRIGAAAVAAAAVAGVVVAPPVASSAGQTPAVAAEPVAKKGVRFLKSGQWPTWYGMPGWEQTEIMPGKKPSGMYCATTPLPTAYTRYREFLGGPAYAMQHITWATDAAAAQALVDAYLANAGGCTAAQLRKGLFAESSIEPLGRAPHVGDGLTLVGVFYHVPAYGYIQPYDAMRLFAVGRVGRVVTTIEFWRDGTRSGSRVKPFRELAKEAVRQLGG